jgi:hypothetical protein
MRKLDAVLTALLLAVGFGSAAHATVNIALQTGSAVYQPGDSITLHAYVTADDFEIDPTVYGAVVYPSAAVTPGGTPVQYALPGTWTLGSLHCDATRCEAFSQISEEGPVAINTADFLIATLEFDILASAPPGTYSFNWQTTPSGPLDFFGLTDAPGASFMVVPEPAAATLLGAGLLGLGLRAARRRSA